MKLKELRMGKCVTQHDVATSIGCTSNVYSRYERGVRWPDRDTLIKMSKYFGASVDYIIGNTDI